MRFLSRSLGSFALVISAVQTVACGGDDPVGGGNTPGEPMSAMIAAQEWKAQSTSAAAGGGGSYVITGIRTSAPAYTTSISLSNIGGTGTYLLGVGPTNFGGSAVVSHPTLGGWSTPQSGAAGSVTITSLTATRIVGTYTFTAAPIPPVATNLVVTGGSFDLPLTGTATAPAANAGSKLQGEFASSPYYAAAVSSILTTGASPTLTIAALNNVRSVAISLANMTGPGTYQLSATSPVRSIQVTGNNISNVPTWTSQLAGATGSVVISSVTASRIIGTFSGTLAPVQGTGATSSLAISGSFDIGRQ